MLNRRDFLKTSALGLAGLSLPVRALASRQPAGRFGVHPFVETRPEAVFIMRTRVDDMRNAAAKRETGTAFGRSVFVPYDEGGLPPGSPIDITIPVKLNLKTADAGMYPLEYIIGTITDPFFSEGVFEALKELGIAGKRIRIRENDRGDSFGPYGVIDMVNRVGADFRTDFTGVVGKGLNPGEHFNWTEVPDGRWFQKLPHLEPINQPGTWLLNISKFKTHGMGMTLCCKNLQGIVARPFTPFCARAKDDMGISTEFRMGNSLDTVERSYQHHLAERPIPRWDRPGDNGGIWQEVWSTRTLDNLSVTRPGLNIIEGIYGRDGDCGNNGPHEPLAKTDKLPGVTARDYMANIIVFGKDPFRTDIIGHWLGGHEPGNFGFFHLALERGLSTALDPNKIPVYLWENGSAVLTPIERFPRTPLLTYYLAMDYNGGTEPFYHLVNEPFDYSTVHGISGPPLPKRPEVIVHRSSLINPANPLVPIEYRLPRGGDVRLEIRDKRGRVIAVPVEGHRDGGAHLASWDARNVHPGTYEYRLRSEGKDLKGVILLEN